MTRSRGGPGRAAPVVIRAAATLAVAMGIGRFAYTPILPMMEQQAGLSVAAASDLATANYAGYLIGALAGIAVPGLTRSGRAARASLLVVIATLVLMPATSAPAAWMALRLVAGAASALLFVIAATTMLTRLRQDDAHLAGWGFGGVGLGMALSGSLVLALGQASTWRAAWWGTAALAALLAIPAWLLRPPGAAAPPEQLRVPGERVPGDRVRARPWFAALLISYSLEGVGYIVAGTFLVAAVGRSGPAWLGSGTWVLAGLAALPSPAMWAGLARRWSRSTLLLIALATQAVAIALPALSGGIAPAVISAIAFGNTFMAVSSLGLAIGAHLQFPRAVALLTAGYGAGQIIGPLAVTPLLRGGAVGSYGDALLAAAAIVLAGAMAAATLCVRFPHRLGTAAEPSESRRARLTSSA